MFYEWNVIFLVLMGCGLLSLACVHFLFKETLEPERRLKLNFQQVLSLYRTIFQDQAFDARSMLAVFRCSDVLLYQCFFYHSDGSLSAD